MHAWKKQMMSFIFFQQTLSWFLVVQFVVVQLISRAFRRPFEWSYDFHNFTFHYVTGNCLVRCMIIVAVDEINCYSFRIGQFSYCYCFTKETKRNQFLIRQYNYEYCLQITGSKFNYWDITAEKVELEPREECFRAETTRCGNIEQLWISVCVCGGVRATSIEDRYMSP